MKLIIDEKICAKHKMTLSETLLALSARIEVLEENMDNMLNRGILENDNYGCKVTQSWSDVLDEIISESSNEISDERLLNLAVKIQNCFPASKMVDRFGKPTAYYYRCNKNEIMAKLKKFFLKFGNYSDDDIIDATKRYVSSFNGNYTGMRLAKYFIWKDDKKMQDDDSVKVESISDLATFLENKESEEDSVVVNEDWKRYARN